MDEVYKIIDCININNFINDLIYQTIDKVEILAGR